MTDKDDTIRLNMIHSSAITEEGRRLLGGSDGPVALRFSRKKNGLIPILPVGKVRLRLLDETGQPQSGGQARVTLEKGNRTLSEKVVTAGPTGYARTEFAEEAGEDTKIKVTPLIEGERQEDQARIIDSSPGNQRSLHEIRARGKFRRTSDGRRVDLASFTSPPDPTDAEIAPELFHPSVIEKNGACALDFTASVETRQFFFNQIIRAESPVAGGELVPTHRVSNRTEIHQPVPFDWLAEEDSVRQPRTPVLGKLNFYKQSWTRIGHGVGQLLYSLALAPCEETKIAMIEWMREERGRRRERTGVRERLQHQLHRDRMIEEIVEGSVDEEQEGESSSSQFGGGLTGGLSGKLGDKVLGSLGLSLGGSSASSESFSEAHREITGNTLHNLSDSVTQRSTAMRSLRSMVVTQSQQVEQENIRTRIIRNQNRNHAMTVEYFQVLEHYKVQTELASQVDVLLVPYEVPAFLWDETPRFDAFTFREEMRRLKQELSSAANNVQLGSTFEFPRSDEDNVKLDSATAAKEAIASTLAAILSEARTPRELEDLAWKAGNAAWEAYIHRIQSRVNAFSLDVSRSDVTIEHGGLARIGSLDINLFVSRKDLHAEVRRLIHDALSVLSEGGRIHHQSALISWLDRYADDIHELLPTEHHVGVEALYRLVHTPEIYVSEQPTATVSRWTIELREGWRPGVSIIVHTSDRQEIKLKHESEREGSAISKFSSRPIDLMSVEKIEINYSPEEAKFNKIKESSNFFEKAGKSVGAFAQSVFSEETFKEQVEVFNKYHLKHLRVTAHTDPSKYLENSKSFTIVDVIDIGKTLKADEPSWDHDTTQAPTISFDLTETRRYRDYSDLEKLITHIKANRMPYLRALWLREDPDRRALRLEKYQHPFEDDAGNQRYFPLLDLIENRAVGVMGNMVAFPLQEQGQPGLYPGDPAEVALARRAEEAPSLDEFRVDPILVSLPTRGVYAETLLSKCNATEIRDINRMVDPEQRCDISAPDITGITPGSRRSDVTPQPSQLPSPSINIQNPPSAPAPTGMSGLLKGLTAGDIFRDMSLGSETVGAAQALAQRAMKESGAAQRATLEELSSMLEQDEQQKGGAAEKRARGAAKQRVQSAADEAFRNTEASRLRDLGQAIDESKMSEEDKAVSRRRAFHAEERPIEPVIHGDGGKAPVVLILSPSRSAELADHYKQTVLIGTQRKRNAEVATADSWKNIHSILSKYEKIDRLIFLGYHGYPGGLTVGESYHDLETAASKLERLGNLPQVEQIALESCNIARDAAKIVPFGDIFKVSTIFGYDQFWGHCLVKESFQQGAEKNEIEARLEKFRSVSDHIMGRSVDDLETEVLGNVSQGAYVLQFFVEWFHPDQTSPEDCAAERVAEFLKQNPVASRSDAGLKTWSSENAERLEGPAGGRVNLVMIEF